MSRTKSLYTKGSVGSIFVATLFIALLFVAALKSQSILDWLNYYQYQPSSDVVKFTKDTGMTDHGRFIFYASQPTVAQAADFNQQCDKIDASTAILGCYRGGRIYIYDIQEPKLPGIRATTAAHEMLHAAYGRLSKSERASIDSLVEKQYEQLKSNEKLAAKIQFYDKTEPGERNNELHSVLGTEFKDLMPELDDYYKKYFVDRSVVVSLYQNYNSVFENLKSQADDIGLKTKQLRDSIDRDRGEYERESALLRRDIDVFNQKASGGGFITEAEFSSQRQILLARTGSLDKLRGNINNDINEYNRLITEYNNLAVQTESLNRSIDSHLAPTPSL